MTDRIGLVEAVSKPLGLFTLVLLIVEATLLANLVAIPEELRGFVIYSAVALIVLIVLLVAGIAIWRPDALHGRSRFDEEMARSLAVDVFSALSMYVSNLPSAEERLEAYETFVAVIETGASEYDATIRRTMAEVVRGRSALLGGTKGP